MQTQHRHLKWKLSFARSLFYYQGHSFPTNKTLTQLMQILNVRDIMKIFGMAEYYQNTQRF